MADAVDLSEYNGGSLVGTVVLFLFLTYVSVFLRTYVRAFMTKSFLLDDWLMLAAQAVFTISCVFILVGVSDGIGRHNRALPQRKEINALMWQALATATYVLNMMFIKLSIGVFLLRLAVQRRYKWILYVSMVVVLIWSLVLWFWDIFQCSPVQAQWDYTILNHKCVSPQAVVNAAYALSSMTIVTDWLYALLPIPIIWKVKMSVQAKATVVLILGLGIFASIATLIRLKFLADLTDLPDLLFAGTDAMVWTIVEPGVAIVASSLVTIRPLLRRMRIKGFQSTENSRSYGISRRSGRSGFSCMGSRANRSQQGGVVMPGYGPGDVTLVNLERMENGRAGTKTSTSARVKGGFASQDTTLASKASAKSAPAWGGGVAITVRKDGITGQSTPRSDVFVIEGPQAAHQPWGRTGTESPVTPEESEHIQGLTAPVQTNGSRLSTRFSIIECPIQSPGYRYS